MRLFERGPGKGTPFDWLVVGLGNPARSTPAPATTSARRVVRLLAAAATTP
jgi:hypothetical protein